MRVLLKRLAILLILAAAAAAALSWPHLHDVETGRTPEYADLRPRTYDASPSDAAGVVEAAVERLRWTRVGSGSGPGGHEVKAIARVPILRLPSEITVKIKREKGRTLVTVRSTSRWAPWDFGQNARFIRAFQAEMDTQMK
jgi:hypothetical protein